MARSDDAAIREAEAIWASAQSLQGTEAMVWAKAYLDFMGPEVERLPGGRIPATIGVVEDLPLSYVREGHGRVVAEPGPAIIARVAIGQRLRAVHCIHVQTAFDGSTNATNRQLKDPAMRDAHITTIGSPVGGYIPLSAKSAARTLVLTTSLLSGLVLAAASDVEVWACIDMEGMCGLSIPSSRRNSFDRVILAPDAGVYAAHRSASAAAKIARMLPGVELVLAPSRVPGTFDHLTEESMPSWSAVWAWLKWQISQIEDSNWPSGIGSFDDAVRDLGRSVLVEGEIVDGGKGPAGHPIPSTDSDRARLHLLDWWVPTNTEWSAWRLLYIRKTWYKWEDGSWSQIDEDDVRYEVQEWCRDFVELTNRGEKPFAPSDTALRAIMKSIAGEVRIGQPRGRRFWLGAAFDRDGSPIWGRKPWRRVLEHPAEEKLPPADRVLPVADGLLDLTAWLHDAGTIRLLDATPRLFATAAIEHDIRWDEARKAHVEGRLESHALSLCPNVHEQLFAAFHDAGDDRAAPDNIREFWKLLGSLLTPDIMWQNGSIFFWHGPGGARKGTLLRLVQDWLGDRLYHMTGFGQVEDRSHVAAFRGRHAGLISDQTTPAKADLPKFVELLKASSGGDSVSTRDLWERESDNASEPMSIRWVIVCNQIPHIPDSSGAVMRRVIVLDFKNLIEKAEPGVEARMRGGREMEGVTLMALLGLRWLEDDGGFVQPPSSSSPLGVLESVTAPLVDFIDRYLVIDDPEAKCDGTSLYEAYKVFCAGEGDRYVKKLRDLEGELLAPLRQRGWRGHVGKIDNRRWWHGVSVNTVAVAHDSATETKPGEYDGSDDLGGIPY